MLTVIFLAAAADWAPPKYGDVDYPGAGRQSSTRLTCPLDHFITDNDATISWSTKTVGALDEY